MMYSIHVYKLFRFACNILFALAFCLKTKFGWIRFPESNQWSVFVAFPISYILLIHLFSQRRLLRKNLRIVTYKRSKNEQPKEQYVNERISHQSKKKYGGLHLTVKIHKLRDKNKYWFKQCVRGKVWEKLNNYEFLVKTNKIFASKIEVKNKNQSESRT